MDDLAPRLSQLSADIDRLEAAVAPLLLDGHQTTTSQRLPLLDRAKLQVLAGYALESTLFCSLGLAGVDARSHAVFRELLRVRQYMQKIDAVEKKSSAADDGPASRLDKAAAIRFVKADMDDPDVRAKLGQLEKEAAAAAKTSRNAGSSSSRSRKRGGASSAGDRRDSSNLAKRPKKSGRPS
ncbi:exosome-associated family protein [Grosmannia clavigera kw1407]|uniref:Exosome complex protein n=1 Tax=Grosmannia clavigera (strain kw1407 / UAMH 11150) TaxID=655863 RepID=F0XT72_GROCL|nr:exosome-associated family protein [Grosmannia clavigera kw1407]EFW99161.1 exosome-associated family protein [Grosmannia clavigera kw1407]